MNRSWLIIPALLALSVRITGCDLFQTRDPQAPSQTSSCFQPASGADIVLDNFKCAVEEANVDNYMRCFADPLSSPRQFSFVASGDFQGAFQAWNLEDERQYFLNLGRPADAVPSLILSPTQPPNRSSDSVVFYMNYTLYFPHRRTGVSQLVRGYMELSVGVNPNRQWSIYLWRDSRTVSDSTWSYLKANI